MLAVTFAPPVLHIPDGFLSVLVALSLWLVTIAVIVVALRRVNADLGERQVPMMGVLAAAIFAGQMLNFPVAGGTSGHLLGAALATILMGPWAAVIIMTCVIGIQGLIFQDGGLLAMGANIFNMGIVGVVVTHFVYRSTRAAAGNRVWSIFVGGFLSAWLSVVLSALITGLELALSGTSPANVAIPAMGGVHILIGLGEALITVGALAFLYFTRPDLLKIGEAKPAGRGVWLAGLVIAIAVAVASPLASSHPDGLEWVAEQQGFLMHAQSAPYHIVPDYIFPGIENQALATILAGIVGALLVFAVAFGIAYARRNKNAASAAPQSQH
ncbi:MAG: cobalamin biosynthesis protein CbiM [Chloroflexota bacterium]|nr:MAG: cobalamin biosynthesis protein CbiM [Chloroflexota bacterium]